jgi:hypothetical protein
MTYAVEMGSSGTIGIQNFIKIGYSIKKLPGGYADTQTHRMEIS